MIRIAREACRVGRGWGFSTETCGKESGPSSFAELYSGGDSMIRNFIRTTVALCAAIVLSAAIAMAAKGKQVYIYKDAVLPDGQVLKAGTYTVRMSAKADAVEFLQKEKVVAKSHCKCTILEKKNRQTEVQYIDKDGKNTIQALRLAGENREMSFEASGM
jgi:hypothetical protein